MGFRVMRLKKLLVWLKRRRNPPKKDGSRTVSYTLQWRDENYEERFESLGAELTEAEAEAKRSAYSEWLNGNSGDDPQQFIEQMAKRNQRAMEKLKLVAGADPRKWPFRKMFGKDASKWYARFDELLLMRQVRPEVDAETLLQQFRVQQTAEYEVLVDVLESELALEKNIKMLLLFHAGETVWAAMLQHSKNWEWSSESSQFIEQFRTRYPVEFQKVEQELSLEDQLKNASLPPKEIAKKLRDFARGELEIPSDASHAPGRSIVLPSQL